MKEIYSFKEDDDYDDDDREVQEILQHNRSLTPEGTTEEYYAYYHPQYSSSNDSSDILEDTQAILQSLQGGEQNSTYNERIDISNISTPENIEQAAQIMQGLDENLSNFLEVYIILYYPELPMNEDGNCCLM